MFLHEWNIDFFNCGVLCWLHTHPLAMKLKIGGLIFMAALINWSEWIMRFLALVGFVTIWVSIIFVIMVQAHMNDWPEYDEEEDEWP